MNMKKFTEWYGPKFSSGAEAIVTVTVANSATVGEEDYEDSCDKAIGEVRRDLPPGWSAEWAGVGNTDSSGECTEDIIISR